MKKSYALQKEKKKCFKCEKLNHFAKMCNSNNEVNRIIDDSESSSNEDDQDFNICSVNNFRFTSRSDCAMVTVLIGKESVPMKFKVDTGSPCNLIPKICTRNLKVI